LQTSRPPIDIPDWPWPLRIVTLGGLSVAEAAGGESGIAGARGRPLQLLKLLIALGASDVPAQHVAEILWPHVDIDYSSKSLTINLHRLRRLLGNDDAIVLRDGRLSLNPTMVWLDTVAMDALVTELETLSRRPGGIASVAELRRDAERLLDLYRGPFLAAEDEFPCFVQRRDEYRAAFIRGMDSLARAMEGRDESNAAAEWYESALQKDPRAESLYRRLMRLYHSDGRDRDAHGVYERCCMALAAANITPSAETRSMYETLVQQAGAREV